MFRNKEMKWTEEYSTGDTEIDRQHQTLFAYVEDFREVLEKGCTSKTYEGVLEFLALYFESHFGFEETCMYAHKCPVADKNRAEHAGFVKVVAEASDDFRAHGFSTAKATHLMDLLDSWMDSHIRRVDVQLRDYV